MNQKEFINYSSKESPKSIEAEKLPHYFIMITRHAERLPSGELSPEGIAHAKAKGEELKNVEVLKSYASNHPSGRTYETAENISEIADIKTPLTQERYQTRRVKGIQYDVLDHSILGEAKLLIEEATLNEINKEHPDLESMIKSESDKNKDITKVDSKGEKIVNIEKLSKAIQKQIAPIRQKYQKIGFEKILGNSEAVKNMAIGLSHQLISKEKLLARYSKNRNEQNNPPKKDVVINLNTHGLFTESLFKHTGVLVKPDGEKINGIDDKEMENLGGYIKPAESIYLDIGTDPNNIPAQIPVIFEKDRAINSKIFIDSAKVEQLSNDFKE